MAYNLEKCIHIIKIQQFLPSKHVISKVSISEQGAVRGYAMPPCVGEMAC